MKRIWKAGISGIALGIVLGSVPGFALDRSQYAAPAGESAAQANLEKQVRHQLRLLPYYSVFDNLQFRVDGRDVELFGEVRNPVLKSDAQNVVKRIEGVASVTNNIKVLPLSNFDDRIRIATYRAVYGASDLYRYAMGASPSIHIIVENGHVTLVGYVANEMDKNIAFIRANGVAGVFSVKNDLQIG